MWLREPPETTILRHKLGRSRAVRALCTHGPRCASVGCFCRSRGPSRPGKQEAFASRPRLAPRVHRGVWREPAHERRAVALSPCRPVALRARASNPGPVRLGRVGSERPFREDTIEAPATGSTIANERCEGAMNALVAHCIVMIRCRPHFDSRRSRLSPNPSATAARFSRAEGRRGS